MESVVILGASISAHTTATFLKQQNPDLKVVVIGSYDKRLPLVGESLTEYSTQLFHEIGLGEHLEEDQYHKYGLTFYFKEDLKNPKDRTYAVHEAPYLPPMPAHLINRFTFDEYLTDFSLKNGVEMIDGRITAVSVDGNSGHKVNVKLPDGSMKSVEAKWIIDATGRSRFLGRTLRLPKESKYPRSSFWFRLVDFDRKALFNIDAAKKPQHYFDSYYVTHHFMGKATWLWLIPVRTKDYKEMISVGIVWRTDLIEQKINSIEQFLEVVRKEHPVIAEFVETGKVIDTALYSNYMYETPHVYSKDRWFLVGDAGDAVDPLYSTGLVMTAIQIRQIGEIIKQDRKKMLNPALISDFESGYKLLRNTMQMGINAYYEVMHDPYQTNLRMHLISTYYFFFMLPAWLSGCMFDHRGIRWFYREMMRGKADYISLLILIGDASMKRGKVKASEMENLYAKKSVNWELRGPNNSAIPKYMAILWIRFSLFRLRFLKESGFKNTWMHIGAAVRGFCRAGFLYGAWATGLARIDLVKRALGLKWNEPLTTPLMTEMSGSAMPHCKDSSMANEMGEMTQEEAA